jgi:4-hydroxybenzoate polyprenyltransferase
MIPPPAISEQQIWLVAIGIIAVDLTLFMVPIVPFLAAYVLIVRPAWFKDFIDDVYDRS